MYRYKEKKLKKTITLAARIKMSFVSAMQNECKNKLQDKNTKNPNINLLEVLPFACSMNLDSAFLCDNFDFSPIHSIE